MHLASSFQQWRMIAVIGSSKNESVVFKPWRYDEVTEQLVQQQQQSPKPPTPSITPVLRDAVRNQLEEWAWARATEDVIHAQFSSALAESSQSSATTSQVWAYILQERLVAVMIISTAFQPKGKCHISSLWVCPGQRRKGIARQFIAAATQRMKDGDGMTTVTVSTFGEHLVFWRKMGFYPVPWRLHAKPQAALLELQLASRDA